MATLAQKRQAKKAFETVIKAFKKKNWKYEADPEKLQVRTSFTGDDLKMPLTITVDPERDLVRIYSFLPEKFPSDKIAIGAYAISVVNWKILNGTFDFKAADGTVMFRVVNSYRNSKMSPDVIEYMVNITVGTVDDYNDKIVDLALGKIDLNTYIEKINKK